MILGRTFLFRTKNVYSKTTWNKQLFPTCPRVVHNKIKKTHKYGVRQSFFDDFILNTTQHNTIQWMLPTCSDDALDSQYFIFCKLFVTTPLFVSIFRSMVVPVCLNELSCRGVAQSYIHILLLYFFIWRGGVIEYVDLSYGPLRGKTCFMELHIVWFLFILFHGTIIFLYV